MSAPHGECQMHLCSAREKFCVAYEIYTHFQAAIFQVLGLNIFRVRLTSISHAQALPSLCSPPYQQYTPVLTHRMESPLYAAPSPLSPPNSAAVHEHHLERTTLVYHQALLPSSAHTLQCICLCPLLTNKVKSLSSHVRQTWLAALIR